MNGMNRRGFLTSGTAAVAALAGCSGVPGLGEDGRNETSGTPRRGSFTLQTLAVDGASDGEVTVQPPGEVVLLDFFATWCDACRPQLTELREVHENNPDVHMLSITWERERQTIHTFWDRYGGAWPVALDPHVQAGSRYDVNGLPTMLVIDPQGSVVWRRTDMARAGTIESQLDAARQ